ncbi:hypothetical protein Tco_0558427 [Tanacetum coccineum]
MEIQIMKESLSYEKEVMKSVFDLVETLTIVPEPVVVEPKVVSQPKVWYDDPIIEEYELDSDDEYVIEPSKEQEKPSFAFVNTVKHVKTPRETVKEQNTCSPSPKVNKRDWNGSMSKRLGLGYGFTKKACFVCGSFSHLIRDYGFHKKRMAKQVGLNKKKVNTARQNPFSQETETSTARKVNTARPIVDSNKRIFRYLKGKPKLGLWYPRVSSFDLEAYSDSDYAGANLDRKSTTRGCQFLGRRLISWQCKKQTIVATSTTEAEYVVLPNCMWASIVDSESNVRLWIQFYETQRSTIDNGKHQYALTKLSTARPKLSTDNTKIESMKLEAMVEERRIFKCWFHYHITNGHQFTMSNRHQELASPEQTAPGKDFLNPLMADSLPKTIWFSTHHALQNMAIPGQMATGKEISNPFMAGSLPKTT